MNHENKDERLDCVPAVPPDGLQAGSNCRFPHGDHHVPGANGGDLCTGGYHNIGSADRCSRFANHYPQASYKWSFTNHTSSA